MSTNAERLRTIGPIGERFEERVPESPAVRGSRHDGSPRADVEGTPSQRNAFAFAMRASASRHRASTSFRSAARLNLALHRLLRGEAGRDEMQTAARGPQESRELLRSGSRSRTLHGAKR